MVDIADVLVEQNMSLVNLTLSDLWKKLNKSYMGHPKTYQENTLYNDIIYDLIAPSEIPTSGRMAANIDNLHDRDVPDRKTNTKVKLEEGESRGDRLKDLCRHWGIDVFFDPMGIFTTQDRMAHNHADRQPVWTFKSSPTDKEGRHGGLVSIRRSFNDDNLYNKVVIIGTGDKKGTRKKPIRVSREDNHTKSKTSIDLIGERVYFHSTDKIHSLHEANVALDKAWKLRFQLSEEIEAGVLVNPALEANDMVRFLEPDFAKLDGTYILNAFDIPFVTSKQTVKAANIIRTEDL